MTGLLLGLLFGFLSSISPISPLSAAILLETLHLLNVPGTAEIASTTCYIFGSITSTCKEAYVPDVIGTVEADLDTHQISSIHRREYQAYLAWYKIGMFAVIPAAIVLIEYFIPGFISIPASLSIGVLFCLGIVLKTRHSLAGLVFVAVYGLAFWLVKDSLYTAYILGSGAIIIPNLMSKPVIVLEEISDETPEEFRESLDGLFFNSSSLLNLRTLVLPFAYTIFTMGISASIVSKLVGEVGIAKKAYDVLSHTIMEAILTGLFITGTFTGKSGIGMIARPEFISLEMVITIVLAATIWQLYIADQTSNFWDEVSSSTNTHKGIKLATLSVTVATVVFAGGPIGTLACAICFLAPAICQRAVKQDVGIKNVLFTIPMIGNP